MQIQIEPGQIEAFCRKWKIREFALFGSVLRDDFRPDSDVDVLVEFETDAAHSLFDHVRMESELTLIFGRNVDLVEKAAMRNPYIRRHALAHAEVVFAA